MLPPLRTSRLALQPFRPDDVDALHALWTDPAVRQYLWDDEVITRSRALEVVEGAIAAGSATGVGMWTLRELDAADVVIGFCGLRHLARAQAVELLFALLPQWWGAGLAVEASTAVLRYAFTDLDLTRVLAGADPPNTRSFAVMERLGMTPLGDTVADAPAYFRRAGG